MGNGEWGMGNGEWGMKRSKPLASMVKRSPSGSHDSPPSQGEGGLPAGLFDVAENFAAAASGHGLINLHVDAVGKKTDGYVGLHEIHAAGVVAAEILEVRMGRIGTIPKYCLTTSYNPTGYCVRRPSVCCSNRRLRRGI